jgi:glycerate kinase
MRILVCPQEFKESLTSRQAAGAMALGIRRAGEDIEVDLAPMADGGPGTIDAVLSSVKGRRMKATVRDPLGRPREAIWALLDEKTALIETAEASGLALLRPEERDPRRTSTYGTAELIRAALDEGCRRLIVAIGGSATNDGGAGMAQALGVRLLDVAGNELEPGGAALMKLQRIDVSGLDPRVRSCEIVVAADAVNPLLGPAGASLVYGPQKGGTPEAVAELEVALQHYAGVVKRELDVDIATVSGAGAAGGLGGGLVAFLGARITSGAEFVAEAIGLAGRIERADVVFTGEGRLDSQTEYGKSVAVVARLAKERRCPVVVFAGSVADDADLAPLRLDAVVPVAIGPMTREEMFAKSDELLSSAAEQATRLLLLGGSFAR